MIMFISSKIKESYRCINEKPEFLENFHWKKWKHLSITDVRICYNFVLDSELNFQLSS